MNFITTAQPVGDLTNVELGGKGFGLMRMASWGINVPSAIIIPTDVCRDYMKKPKAVMKEVVAALPAIKAFFTAEFGYMPLVSVRSGARSSMPGMMDTILNVGLDPKTLPMWEEKLGKACVSDSHERLAHMYGDVVHGAAKGTFTEGDLPYADDQLIDSIEAVFKSWNNDRAKDYRKLNNIPDDWGTAVVVQSMVFGNFNDQSATGVLFSRNPATGENELTGEFLVNAQGEDVVAGTRTPVDISLLPEWSEGIATELAKCAEVLEAKASDVQDIEFTVQDGTLYILQTRNAKRTPTAAVRIAVELQEEGFITLDQVFERVPYETYLQAGATTIDTAFTVKPHGVGIPASVGVARGVAKFSSKAAIASTEPCILMSAETTPDDLMGMNASLGILTSTGGSTSHAAVVARAMNKVCVVGCQDMQQVTSIKGGAVWSVGGKTVNEGDIITIDGATGRIWVGVDVPVVGGEACAFMGRFADLAVKRLNAAEVVHSLSDMVDGKQHVLTTYTGLTQSEILVALPKLSGILDLSHEVDFLPAYMLSVAMLGGTDHIAVAQQAKVDALLSYIGDKSKFSLFAPKSLSAYQIGLLGKAGYQTLNTLTSIEDALYASGFVLSGANNYSKDINRVLELRVKAGDTLSSWFLGASVPNYSEKTQASTGLTRTQAVRRAY